MVKSEFIKTISEKSGFSAGDIKIVVDCFINTVVDTLKNGDSVSMVGFGEFYSHKRQASTVKHPSTKELIEIPEMNLPKFKASKVFKEALK